MIKKFTFVVIIVSSLMAILLLSPIALGWFHDATVSDASVDGAIIGSYFEYGDGSEAHPFGIAQPKQLYYLAWLQDLGYFNKSDNGQIKQVYFELSNKYGDVIDFSEGDTPYIIPPIGTTTYPFVGSFDGKGVTLANLTIDNEYVSLVTPPENDGTTAYSEVLSGVQIVGMFGVVGAVGQDTTAANATVNGATYATAVNQISNFQVDGVTIKSTTPKDNYTVLGILAGYVNGTISGVAISNSSVDVGNGITHLSSIEGNNPVISDYGLVGYCEEAYKEELSITSVTANLPVETQNIIYKSTQSEGEGFGGSIKMTDLFDRLNSIVSNNSYRATSSFSRYETVVVDEATGEELSRTTTGTATPTTTWHTISRDDGNYYVSYVGSDNSQKYLYLYQEEKTVTTITRKDQYENGYLISNGTQYLILNNNHAISSTVDSSTANGWVLDNSGYLYTYTDDGYKYYLYATTTLTASTTQYTTFTKNSDNTLSYTYNSRTYYIVYDDVNGWTVSRLPNAYTIGDGTNYLSNTGTTVTSVTSNAASWAIDNGRIYTVYNNNIYYLNGTNTLSMSTTASTTTWSYDEANHQLSYTYGGRTWYLFNTNDTWKVFYEETAYLISQDGNYLNIASGSSVSYGTDADSATLWAIDDGVISTYYNSSIYYLKANNYSVTVGTSAPTTWTHNNDGTLSYTNETTYYLVFDNGWYLYPTLELSSIHSGDNYLSNNGTSIANAETNSYWMSNGAGKYFKIVNNNIYYLVAQTRGLSLNSNETNGTVFTYDSTNKRLSCTLSGDTYYVIYDGSNWVVSESYISEGTIVVGYQGTNYYLNASTTGVSAGRNETQATQWLYQSSTGHIYTTISGTKYYLQGILNPIQGISSTNLTVTNDINNATSWDYYDDTLSCYLKVDNIDTQYTIVYNNSLIKLMNVDSNYYTVYNSNNSNYLNVTSNGTPSLTNTTPDTYGNTLWTFSNTSQSNGTRFTLSTIINGITYYVLMSTNNNGAASLTTTPTNLKWYAGNGNNRYIQPTSVEYDLGYNNGWKSINSSNNSYRMSRTQYAPTAADVTINGVESQVEVDSDGLNAETLLEEIDRTNINLLKSIDGMLQFANKQVQVVVRDNGVKQGSDEYYTAFPLNAENTSPFTVKDSNTGYIVSGYSFRHSSDNAKHGDIRVSKYTKSTNLNTAYNGGTNMVDSRLEILTPRFNNGSDQWYRISDNYNKNNNSVSSSISGYTKMSYTQLGLVRYEDAREALKDMLSGTYVYGLHFMDSTININNYVTLPQANIYGDNTLTNYQLPNDCIDFNVKRRGFVTVFGGTYFPGNSAFFSLHEITRDENNNLSSIKEIVEIYNPTGNNNDFIYKYSDGSYSSDKPRGALAFKLEWMTNPSVFVDNAVYYFEIPVNGGEYALGSVPGSDGAYLFYLDIAANAGTAEDKDRRTITEIFKSYEYDFELPKGVQLVESGDSYDAQHPYETALVKYKDGFSGDSLLNIEDGVFGYTDNVNTELSFVGGTLTSSSGSSSNTYYPKGYKIKYIENIIDIGRDTANPDIMRVEYIDSYNSSGTFTGRVVDIYAGVDVTDKEEDLVKIISFTYTSTAGYDNTVMRCVRAASIGGFNIVFNQNVTITSTDITEEDVHVNFGSSTGSVLITAFKGQPLTNQAVTAVNMVYSDSNYENAYVAPTYGDELLEYYYYKKSTATSTDKTIYFKTVDNVLSMTDKNSNLVLTPKLAYQVNSQTLNYNVDISTTGDAFTVYAWLLDGSNRTVATHTEDSATSGHHVVEANVTIAIGSVKLNGTTLTTQKQDIEVSSGS